MLAVRCGNVADEESFKNQVTEVGGNPRSFNFQFVFYLSQ